MLNLPKGNRVSFLTFGTHPRFKEVFFLILTGIIAGTFSLLIFKESIPQIFHHAIPVAGDGSLNTFYLSLVEGNSYWNSLTQHLTSSSYGWPGFVDFTNYPMGQSFEMLILKFIVSLFGVINPAAIIHVVAILKAIPISIATYIFARTLGISNIFASIAGIAYSISSFNLIRSEGHFFLALTWSLPLALAAIFVAYQDYLRSARGQNINKRKYVILKVCLLSFFSSFSHYYYSIFIILTYTFIIFLSFLNEIPLLSRNFAIFRTKAFWIKSIKDRILLFTGFLISIVGLGFQIIPILVRTSSMPPLSTISDRNWAESIVYGGTLESYFFDLSHLVVHFLHNPELSAYLQSRTSWEATQNGSTAGLVGYILVLVMIFACMRAFINGRLHGSKFARQMEESMLFLIGLFIFFFALYIVSPFNFAISRIFLPEVRSWGRLSTILCLISIVMICYVATTIRKKLFGYILVLALVVIPTLGDAKIFHDSRPTGNQMNIQYLAAQQSVSTTWEKLQDTFSKGCALINLPIYPFPEFENPTDNNSDYAQLPLVSFKEGYFDWSYPSIKDTIQFRTFQNLVSEQPNFDRASLDYQLESARSTGACGIVLDRSLLVQSETRTFDRMLKDYPGCLVNLGGEQFLGTSRFYALKYSTASCPGKLSSEFNNSQFQALSSDFLWMIDQPFSLNFQNNYEMFTPSSSIAFRVAKTSDRVKGDAIVKFRFLRSKTLITPLPIKICLTYGKGVFPICNSSTVGNDSEIDLRIPSRAMSKTPLKINASLIGPKDPTIQAWGLIVK